MLIPAVRSVLDRLGLSLHRKDSIDRLYREVERLRRGGGSQLASDVPPPPIESSTGAEDDPRLKAKYDRVRAALDWYEQNRSRFLTTQDHDAEHKQKRIVNRIADFGNSDFADLASWLFASSLTNHRILHQRIDEGALLWRSVKATAGPILEVGRAAGGSTVTILGASGNRPVVSVDRGPVHAELVAHVFSRPDVRERLTLYTQNSREAIAENVFGMIFIDADHSYEGVCHDIASVWNMLKPFDGKPAIAVFHDAAENPIAYVKQVKRACDELIAEPGVAKVVETWGSMLALEKLGDIDTDRWHAKEDKDVWKKFAGSDYPVLAPTLGRGQLRPEGAPPFHVKRAAPSVLGEENIETPAWIKTGISIEPVYPEADNPARFIREALVGGIHRIEKAFKRGISRFRLTAFLRPVRSKVVRFSVFDAAHVAWMEIDFELTNASRIMQPQTRDRAEILDASFLYGNGFFRCEFAAALPASAVATSISFTVLDDAGAPEHDGNPERGFLLNLASVRELE